jgi:hypothetical protein
MVKLTLRQSVHDVLAPAAQVWNLYEKHCKNGAKIEYQQNMVNVSHFEESFVGKYLPFAFLATVTNSLKGFDNAFAWLRDRHAEKPLEPKTPCLTYEWRSPYINVSLDRYKPWLPEAVVPQMMELLAPHWEDFLPPQPPV